MVWAYDIQNKRNRQFKISRIKQVKIKKLNWEYQKNHNKLPVDVFRISGTKAEKCIIKLNLRAGNLLKEEYPLAEKLLSKNSDKTYIFNGLIYGYEGVGRFCMGLIDGIEIISPPGLKTYISNKMKNYLNK